jgi:hypothetical protein
MFGMDHTKFDGMTTSVEGDVLTINIDALTPKLNFRWRDISEALARRRFPAFNTINIQNSGNVVRSIPSNGKIAEHFGGGYTYNLKYQDDLYYDILGCHAFYTDMFTDKDGKLVLNSESVRDSRLDDLKAYAALVEYALKALNNQIVLVFNRIEVLCSPGMNRTEIIQTWDNIVRRRNEEAAEKKLARLTATFNNLDDPDLLVVITGTIDGRRVYLSITNDRFGDDRFVKEFHRATFYTGALIKEKNVEWQLKDARERFSEKVADIELARVGLTFTPLTFPG